MSSFNLSEYISYILIYNKAMSSGNEPTPVKTTLLPSQVRLIVVASLPTNPRLDVTLKIPICAKMMHAYSDAQFSQLFVFTSL